MNRSRHALLASVALVVAAPAALSQVTIPINSSDNTATVTYTLLSVVRADDGTPVDSFEFDLDGPPDHYFGFVTSFIYTEGDGYGEIDGTATLGGDTHNYGDSNFDFSAHALGDPMTVTLNTLGMSSAPGSNGSSGIDSYIGLSYVNFAEDEVGDPAALIVTFDIQYNFSMELIEDAGSGQANGFFEGGAIAFYNENPEDDLGLTFTEYYGGPANLMNESGSGQIVFYVPPMESYPYFELRTYLNSTTLVDEAPDCPADVNSDGVLDNGDIGAFVQLFLASDLSADFNNDGILDNGDIGAFVGAFLAGCS
ncbi:MAG: GC-type dockerin domain-anchored protein [Phycisphaerales bacterium JB040]